MQRRALYARELKTSDVRTARNVLRDEANLKGLYPSAKNGGAKRHYYSPPPPLNREERFVRMLKAETSREKKELALIEHLTPTCTYRLKDAMIPVALFNTIALGYAAEQPGHASMFFMSVWRVEAKDDEDETWDFVGGCHAYRFKVGVDGWDKFTGELGIEGDKLVKDNHRGSMFELFTDRLYESAPDHDAFMVRLVKEGGDPARFPTRRFTGDRLVGRASRSAKRMTESSASAGASHFAIVCIAPAHRRSAIELSARRGDATSIRN